MKIHSLTRPKRLLALAVAAAFANSAFAEPVRFSFHTGDRGTQVLLELSREPDDLTVTPPRGEHLQLLTTSFKRCQADRCEQESALRTNKGSYALLVKWPFVKTSPEARLGAAPPTVDS